MSVIINNNYSECNKQFLFYILYNFIKLHINEIPDDVIIQKTLFLTKTLLSNVMLHEVTHP